MTLLIQKRDNGATVSRNPAKFDTMPSNSGPMQYHSVFATRHALPTRSSPTHDMQQRVTTHAFQECRYRGPGRRGRAHQP